MYYKITTLKNQDSVYNLAYQQSTQFFIFIRKHSAVIRNKIRPIPPSLTQQRVQRSRIGHIIFQESDGYNLPGIDPNTNNYLPSFPNPPIPQKLPYYLAVDGLDYYEVENGSTYYDFE